MPQGPCELAPLVRAACFADAVHAQGVVAARDQLLRLGAAQNFDDGGHAEALALLAQSRNAGQELLRLVRPVRERLGLQAVIAGAAIAVVALAKVTQLDGAPAIAALSVIQHLAQLLARDALLLLQRLAGIGIYLLGNQKFRGTNIAGAEVKNAVGLFAIAARAPCFLVIALDGFWQLVVHHPAHVRFVDAHAERNGRDHHLRVIADERVLVIAARRRIQAGVVRQGTNSVLGELGREFIHPAPRQAVNDAGSRMGSHMFQQFGIAARALRPYRIVQVGPVEAGDMQSRLAQGELIHDVLPHARGGGGREREHRHRRKVFAQPCETAVLGAKIMAPFRDAMRLINRESAQAHGGLQLGQEPAEKLRQQQTLRGQIQQLVVAAQQSLHALRRLASVQAGIQEGRWNAVVPQQTHLVLHQRDQRRYHHHHARLQQRGQLKTQGLAAAGGHHRQQIAAGQRIAHHGFLTRAERVEAEMPLQLA